MLVELRPAGRDGGAHQTVLPGSAHPSGESVEWSGEIISPPIVEAKPLRLVVAYLATACLVRRYVSEYASERPAPDLPKLLWELDHDLGRPAYRWIGEPAPDAPRRYPKPRREQTPREHNLAEVVAAIPNNCSWEDWNKVGMAIYAASGGSGQGGVVFDDFSARSPKYDPHTTSSRWDHYHRSPPTQIGMGSLVYLARQAGWKPPRAAS